MYIHFLFQKDGREATSCSTCSYSFWTTCINKDEKTLKMQRWCQTGQRCGNRRGHGVPLPLVYPRHGMGQPAAWNSPELHTHRGPKESLSVSLRAQEWSSLNPQIVPSFDNTYRTLDTDTNTWDHLPYCIGCTRCTVHVISCQYNRYWLDEWGVIKSPTGLGRCGGLACRPFS